ncbi:MAG: hypothetical protein VB055_08395 [Oscillospiraceae bacterium]|nr:hypothetical protein [Oscillospiraceae bacterium]
MYCVKCGVRLDDGLERCPLCGTPVWRPDQEEPEAERKYSGLYPEKVRNARLAGTAFLTALLAMAALVSLQICLKVYGGIAWSGYAMLGIALFYTIVVLPGWFRHPNPMILMPVDHAAVAGYLLYICLVTGGRWFLSFAFPVVGLSCLLLTGVVALLRYLKGGRLYIIGGSVIVAGGFAILLEFFQHITFGSKMFTWSLYVVSACFFFGMFLIVSGFIRPLREYLERRFFL